MSITVKCFASLREQVGIDKTTIPFTNAITIADVWRHITMDPPPDNLLCARNYEYVNFTEELADGDEVAFFPPVTGG